MRYQLAPIYCRPWLLNGLSPKLIESHYENNYGGAMRRLNAITEKLESLDLATTPGYVINGLKREQLVALNSTLLHELYFASLGGAQAATAAGNLSVAKPSGTLAEAIARDFGSFGRWRDEFVAIANGLAGGSGWVLLVYVPRDRRLFNQGASEHSQTVAGGIPILALDMYEHAYHIDFGANAMAQYVGPIPGGLQNYTVFVAGIMSGAKASEAVTGFVKFLKSPFAVSAIRAKGMQID